VADNGRTVVGTLNRRALYASPTMADARVCCKRASATYPGAALFMAGETGGLLAAVFSLRRVSGLTVLVYAAFTISRSVPNHMAYARNGREGNPKLGGAQGKTCRLRAANISKSYPADGGYLASRAHLTLFVGLPHTAGDILRDNARKNSSRSSGHRRKTIALAVDSRVRVPPRRCDAMPQERAGASNT